jgi:alpha/beta superfamily hydrolase
VVRRIESHLLDGPAGPLESLLEAPDDRVPGEVSVLCHPHPLFGGTMHNKVVYRVARGLRKAGAVVLRFNFRGVGRSGGEHAHGTGEIEDARTALEWLRSRYPGLPYSLAGFSFGSRVILKLGCAMAAGGDLPTRLIAVGFPTNSGAPDHLEGCRALKILVQSTHDEHGPRPALEAVYARMASPKRLVWVDARDHFFAGALERLETEIAALDR